MKVFSETALEYAARLLRVFELRPGDEAGIMTLGKRRHRLDDVLDSFLLSISFPPGLADLN